MGTDITMTAEVRRNGVWELAGPLVANEERKYDDSAPEQRPPGLWNDRVTAFFAALTEAKHIHGRSDVINIPSISPPRGIPADASREIRSYAEYCRDHYDAHSFSWLLLRELLKYPWDTPHRMQGYVDPDLAPLFGDGSGPFPFDRWPKDRTCGAAAWSNQGTMVSWHETLRDILGNRLEDLLDYLRSFGGPDDVRIVFWFDS